MKHSKEYAEKLRIAARINKEQGINAAMQKLQQLGCTDAMTFEEIAIVIGVSKQAIQQIIQKAFRKLEHPKLNKQLRYYLDEEDIPDSNLNYFGDNYETM